MKVKCVVLGKTENGSEQRYPNCGASTSSNRRQPFAIMWIVWQTHGGDITNAMQCVHLRQLWSLMLSNLFRGS